jgi:thiol-disulfide isomerase/thioredoxin
MSTRLFHVAALVVASSAAAACAPSRQLPTFATVTSGVSATRSSPASIGSLTLPAFPDGKSQTLGALRGKVVLVDVWATYCAPCKESLPEVQAYAEELRGQPFELVTINIDETDAPVAPFLSSLKLSLPVLRDPGAEGLNRVIPITEAPTSFILDQEGVVRFVHRGTNGDTHRKIRAEVQELLGANAASK